MSGTLIAAGSVLLTFWVFAKVHSTVGSKRALAEMPVAVVTTTTAAVPKDHAFDVDTSLWSAKRIAEFRKALSLKADPPVAIMRIPKIGIEAPVFQGTDDLTLNRGLGWIEGTAAPGSDGNSGIAGHRDGFFRPLKDIATGDRIELRTHGRDQWFVVRNVMIVEPKSVGVLAPSKRPALTLVTCYPFYFVGSAPKRLIVRAEPQ